jgi:FKBP-type peptidyl-prolyl cis-trans isomerase FkpA
MKCHIFRGITVIILTLISVVTLLPFSSCNRNEKKVQSPGKSISMMDDSLLNYNKAIASGEEEQIEDFVSRYKWKMTKTSTGLRYMIYLEGKGKKAIRGKTAVIRFELRLLNGELCYSSTTNGLKEFIIGHNTMESGLDEGILLLRVGDRAKFIVPSHLGFGLLGDQKKIPQQATLVYDVELVNLK